MRRCAAILLLLAVSGLSRAYDQVVVVANVDDTQLRLQRQEVRNLFMGNLSRDGLEPVALVPNHPARVVFNTHVVGLTESRVQAYWAQMRFSGRSRPPKEFEDIPHLLSYLRNTPGAVGYVPVDYPTPPDLQVIYRSD